MDEPVVVPDWNVVPDFSTNVIVIPNAKKIQPKLKIKPDYYGLKINECELEKHNTTVLEIIKKFGFTTWVVGRDRQLSKKELPHYHIHFKSSKTIDALRKQKQKEMPNWGMSTKLGPPKADMVNWHCWAGYATKEQVIGMSDDITELDKVEIAKNAHTQAVIKKSKLDWSNKKDEKKQEKKDLETRLYELLDKEYLGKTEVHSFRVAVSFSNAYLAEVGELAPPTTLKSKVWKYLISRKIRSMEEYVQQYF